MYNGLMICDGISLISGNVIDSGPQIIIVFSAFHLFLNQVKDYLLVSRASEFLVRVSISGMQ